MAVDYDELIRRTPIWLFAQNRDIVAEMPAIVEQAEDEVYRVLDHDAFRTVKEVIIGAGVGDDSLIDLTAEDPPVFEVRGMRLGYRDAAGLFTSATPLPRRDLETMTMLFPRGRKRRPRYYTEYDQPLLFRVFPQPEQQYALQITLNEQPARLGPTNQNNVLTDQYPRVIERACLFRGAEFMEDAAKLERWQQQFIVAVQEANAQIARRRRDEVGVAPMVKTNAEGM